MRIQDIPFVMLKCLILTIIIETLIALIIGYRKKDILNVILVNAITNPLVTGLPVFFNVFYSVKARNIALIILEVFTLLFEGIIYKKYLKEKKLNSFVLSLILNASSYGLGLIINGI